MISFHLSSTNRMLFLSLNSSLDRLGLQCDCDILWLYDFISSHSTVEDAECDGVALNSLSRTDNFSHCIAIGMNSLPCASQDQVGSMLIYCHASCINCRSIIIQNYLNLLKS